MRLHHAIIAAWSGFLIGIGAELLIPPTFYYDMEGLGIALAASTSAIISRELGAWSKK